MSDCQMCEYPILDTAYVCTRCADRVRTRLHEAGDLWPETTVAIARLTRFGDRVRLPGGEHPIPVDLDASRDAASVVNVVTTWSRHVWEEAGRVPPTFPAHLLYWLGHQLEWLRYRPEAGEALDELEDAAALVARIVDSPTAHVYLGPCGDGGCTGELYAPRGRPARCRECDAVHDPDKRRAWLLGAAVDVNGSAADMARWVSALRGDLVSASVVRGLAHRGRIAAVGVDRFGRPTYRVGDVLEVLPAGRATGES